MPCLTAAEKMPRLRFDSIPITMSDCSFLGLRSKGQVYDIFGDLFPLLLTNNKMNARSCIVFKTGADPFRIMKCLA